MAESWHVAKGKTKLGPFSREQLKQLAGTGELARRDMVLLAGSGKWVAAISLDGLFGSPERPPTASPKLQSDRTVARAMVTAPQRGPRPAPEPKAVRPPAKWSVGKAVVI